jgi:hypothetical protein
LSPGSADTPYLCSAACGFGISSAQSLRPFVVGITFQPAILSSQGWRWYVLPFLTLLTGTAVFGFLLTCSWALTDSLDSEAFYKLPLAIVYYSMTAFLPVLYPLALLTQHLWRRQMKIGNVEPGAPPNGGAAEPFGKPGVPQGPPSVS